MSKLPSKKRGSGSLSMGRTCSLYTAGSNVNGCMDSIERIGEGVQRSFIKIAIPGFDADTGNNIGQAKERIGDDDYSYQDDLLEKQDQNYVSNYKNTAQLTALACGKKHTVLLTKDGDIYSWGCNKSGQIGVGDSNEEEVLSSHKSITNTSGNPISAKNESFSSEISSELRNSRPDDEGSCEDDNDSNCEPETIHQQQNSQIYPATRISIPNVFLKNNYQKVSAIACGSHHSLCVTKSGCLYSWGSGQYGCIGHGIDVVRYKPTRLFVDHPCNSGGESVEQVYFVGVAAGDFHSLALSISGKIFSFGRGEEGQLGDGFSTNDDSDRLSNNNTNVHYRDKPFAVEFQTSTDMTSLDQCFIMLACGQGGNSSYAITTDRLCYTWGSFYSSDDSDKSIYTFCSSFPKKVCFPLESSTERSDVVAVSAGSSHAVYVMKSGEAWAMGVAGAHLGAGPASNLNWFDIPTRMLLPGNVLVNGVCCGERHTLLSTSKGQVYACGDGDFGKLGLSGDDLEKSSHCQNAIPRRIIFGDNENSLGDKRSDAVLSSFIHPFRAAAEEISKYLNKEKHPYISHNDNDPDGRSKVLKNDDKEKSYYDASIQESEKEEDDDVEVLAFELDMDHFGEDSEGNNNLSHNNFSTSEQMNEEDIIAAIKEQRKALGWRRRLSFEAQRKLSHSTRIVGGAISSSSALLSGVVSAVTGSIDTSNDNNDQGDISENSSSHYEVASSLDTQDSFHGLVGRSSQDIILAAGSSHSFIFVSRAKNGK